MKFHLILLILLLANSTFASTFGFFSPTGDSVKIIVQGNDSDATNLFDSLKTSAIEENGVLKKSIKVESSTFHTIYDISCNKSINSNSASCTISLNSEYMGVLINKEQRSASLVPYGRMDTFASYSEFIIPQNTNTIFLSSDERLEISIEKDPYQGIFRFRIEFGQPTASF